jgi:hypothetical protein
MTDTVPDRVHGTLYTDPRVFADEMRSCWSTVTRPLPTLAFLI